MNQNEDPLNPDLKPGDTHSGFKVLRTVFLPEIQAFLHEFIHEKTRAAYVHISRDDEENSFSVAFKTVPERCGAHSGAHCPLRVPKIPGPGSLLFNAQKKSEQFHERLHRF